MAEASETILETVIQGERLTVAARGAEDRAFWLGAGAGWEDDTLAFVAAHAAPGSVFLDIGAWIGPISLLAARKGARVVALEPDPVARAALERNLGLNGLSAEIVPAALHADDGGLRIFGGRRGLGASTTSALGVSRGAPVDVPTVTVEAVAAMVDGGGPVAMKVDIEGHEYALGPQIAALRERLGATLHLSVHPRQLWKKMRRDWTLFARRRTWERTAELLARFDGAPMRMSGADAPLTQEALRARFGRGWANNRNFSVEIG